MRRYRRLAAIVASSIATWMSVGTLAVLAAWPALVLADSADPGDKCFQLRGASYLECHPYPEEGSFDDVICVPDRCETAADCGGEPCVEIQACLGESQCREPSKTLDSPVETLFGECDDEGACAGDAVCKTERVCVPRTLEDDGCAVRAVSSGEGASWLSAPVAAALLGLLRRRRHSASR
jgi:hypothetical protein